jgi:hypothetical protein
MSDEEKEQEYPYFSEVLDCFVESPEHLLKLSKEMGLTPLGNLRVSDVVGGGPKDGPPPPGSGITFSGESGNPSIMKIVKE